MFSATTWAEKNTVVNMTANENGQQAKVTEDLQLDTILQSPFTYNRANRFDPFVPFISEQILSGQADDKKEVLTGMRLFEPGQLSLVAISTGGEQPLALVQDSTGKGYILKEGIAIGRKGLVKSIMPNSVTIEEEFLNSTGQKRNRTVPMVLRKEGEK